MSNPKPNKEQRGLTDKQLVKKYESGKFSVKKVMGAMLKTPPPSQTEKGKKR